MVQLEILPMVPLVLNGIIGNQRTLNVSRQPMVETLVPMVPLVVPMVPLVSPTACVRDSPNCTIGNFTNGTIGSQ